MAPLFKRWNPKLDRRLETERFVLQPLGVVAAWRLTSPWRRDPEILSGLFQDGTRKGRLAWILSGAIPLDDGRYAYAIVPRAGGAPIGAHIVKTIGYRSAINTVALHDRAWWGKGVVVEVRARLMNHFFAEGGVERFYGVVGARNAASIFNYRRLGFDHVGTWHRAQEDKSNGEVVGVLHFEIFRHKWALGPFSTLDEKAAPQ